MDFVADQLVRRTRFRALTVVDIFTKECLAIEIEQSLKVEHVVAALQRIAMQRGAPKRMFCDNRSEFLGRALDLWAYVNKVRIEFSRPGKPTDNAHVELFNGRLPGEYLNTHWFVAMQDATRAIEAWRTRKLPRQVDRSEVESFIDSIFARKTAGGCLPSASCGRSSL
jgi:putative transposase